MALTFYDSIFLFKNYNILILYDYKYYCDFKMLFNLFIKYITGVSVFGTHIRIPCVIIRSPYIPLEPYITLIYILLKNQSDSIPTFGKYISNFDNICD